MTTLHLPLYDVECAAKYAAAVLNYRALLRRALSKPQRPAHDVFDMVTAATLAGGRITLYGTSAKVYFR